MQRIFVLLLSVWVILSCLALADSVPFAYAHDPRQNPKAMADIVVNPEAVYGFSPSPDSPRLKVYANAIDWTDPAQVAEARAERRAYHENMSELYRMIENMLLEGRNVETIARAVSQRRNELRLEVYRDDPEGLALVKQSNLDVYGNEFGPSADALFEIKYEADMDRLGVMVTAETGIIRYLDMTGNLPAEDMDFMDWQDKPSDSGNNTREEKEEA